MSRGYSGAYRVLVVMDDGPAARMWGATEPASYEDCERACAYFGLGMPFEGRRVLRALIVPVIGAHRTEPGTDFTVSRVP